ncbi:MAG TPA: PIN domain-containing protein [Bryobacteraceae bacterium]|nr:PIN domain-containing protein [Bryobacteraceae bacterium]
MSRIFWDTNLFVYLFEDYKGLSKKTEELRTKMLARGDQLLTSTLTIGEVLVKPLERGATDVCRQYENAITSTAVVIPFDLNAARIYASLRKDRSLRAPDAVQLACAASVGVDLFVTNDNHLQGRHVNGIQFIVAVDAVPL